MEENKKTSTSNDNSIEEDIEEVITEGSSNENKTIEKNSKSNDDFVVKRQELFDLDPGNHFTIDDDALSGGMLKQHFEIEDSDSQKETSTKKDDSFSERTENDFSELPELALKQMERIPSDFKKEALEDITEESDNNTSNGFDSIISLNMIQMLEDKVKDLQEIVSGKDACLALSMQLDSVHRDSLRDWPPSGRDSCSLATTSTEYRTFQEDPGTGPVDYHKEIAERDHIIEKLTNSLQQTVNNRVQQQTQIDKLSTEVQQLRKQLIEPFDTIKKSYWPRDQGSSAGQRLSEISMDLVSESDEDLDRHFLTDNEDKMSTSNRNSKERQLGDTINNLMTVSSDNFDPDMSCISKQIEQFQKYLNPDEVRIFFMIQKKFDDFLSQEIERAKMKYESEVKILTEQLENEKCERDSEINRLRQLLTNVRNGSTELIELRHELEANHAHEMEKLRTYFEKKCADLEKQYSEEIFSHKSQRNSADTSSDISDQDIIQEDKVRPPTKEQLAKRRSREKLYTSPTHRQMTPTTLLSEIHVDPTALGQFGDCKTLEKEPEITVDELKAFYQEKIHEISARCDKTVKSLNDKLRRFETKYADDEFMALLSETAAEDQHWPPELILLREKFTAKSQLEIAQLQIKHEEEMSRLKVDFDKQLHRKNKRNSTFDLSRDLDQIVSERDNFRELSNTFRYLLYELAKCVSICEDDLNGTLIDELQKHGIYQSNKTDHNVNESGDGEQCSIFLNQSTQSNPQLHGASKKLQLVPDVSGLLSVIEDPSLIEFISNNNCDDGDFNLKDCLDKLKCEANGLLVLTENLFKRRKQNEEGGIEKGDSCEEEDGLKSGANRPTNLNRANSLNEQLLQENNSQSQAVLFSLPSDLNRFKIASTEPLGDDIYSLSGPASEMNFQFHELKNRLVKSETARLKLQEELDGTIIKNNELGIELNLLREQLNQMNSQKEDFSEGYGISQLKSPPRLRKENPSTSFTQLQEKARNLLSTPTKTMSENTSVLLQLIEEFCREGDKVVEDSKRDREDLQAQIDAADKQLKATRQFLEDQAAEREVERDEFVKEIGLLKVQIRDKEKERSSFEMASKEFEQMDNQIRDLTQQVAEYEAKKDKLEIELKASIDKIFVLREIVTELETQIERNAINEHVLNEKVKELETFISTQNRSNETLQHEVESLKSDIGHGYQEKIAHLEDQLRNSRSSAEQNVMLDQLTEQLRDIETTLDQKTKTLETLHHAIGSNSCSTNQSEDVSVQYLVKDMNTTPQASPSHTPRHHSLPIDEVQRVFQKLSKHTRVEEAAIKRIRDLEMQVVNIRTGFTELQNERDVLQERMSDQLLRITALQSKLDEQRRRAEELQNKGTSEFTIRIHDLQSEVFNLKEILEARDKQIINLKNQLEQSKGIIDRQEVELELTIQGDHGEVNRLTAEVKSKTEEISKLKEKMKKEMINKLALPDLMETMLADKNEEIDHLKDQLESKDKELQGILEINLENISSKEKNKSNGNGDVDKLSGRTLSDIVSISEYDEPDVIRRAGIEMDTPLLELPGSSFPGKTMESSKCVTGNLTEKRTGDFTMFGVPTSSGMNTFGQPKIFADGMMSKGNTSVTSSFAPRQINFSEFGDDSKIKESTPKIIDHNDGQQIESLRGLLKSSGEQVESLKMSLEAIENEKITEINKLKMELEEKSKRYDHLLGEKKNLEERIESLDKKLLSSCQLENELKAKAAALVSLEKELYEKTTQVEELEKQLVCETTENADLKSQIENLSAHNTSLTNKIGNANSSNEQVKTLIMQIELLNNMMKEKDDILTKYEKNQLNSQQNEKDYLERISEIEQKMHQRENALQLELNAVRAELSEKVLLYETSLLEVQSCRVKIESLNENLNDRDKLIASLSSQSQKRLELNEPDNIKELLQTIQELEQRNSALEAELEKVRSQLSENSRPFSLDEIAEQVEKELNYSAQLDSNILKAIESEEENNLDNQFKINNNKPVDAHIIGQVQMLKTQLESEKENSAHLQQQLNEIKLQFQDIQQQDADIIEAMRLRLEEAIEKEIGLHKILDDEREKCERLTTQMAVLQRTEARKTSLLLKSPPDSPRKSRLTDDSDLSERLKGEIKILTAQNERERERVNDMQRVLEREKVRFERDLSDRIEYGDKLKREMDKLSREKDSAIEEAEHLQERLTLASREIESLEVRISTLQESETRRVHRRGKERTETTQNAVELQELRTKVLQLEAERDHLNQMMEMLRGDIERGAKRESKLAESLANTANDNSIPEIFMEKLKEMNFLLSENANENRQMAETVYQLTEERRILQRKCDELEANRHAGMLYGPTDSEERANHLFGKYLRVESHRKALVHQKRYLMIVVKTYQDNEAKVLPLLNGGAMKRPKRRSFKSVALIIIAIERMKFIARRWHNSKVVVSKAVFNLVMQKRAPATTSGGVQPSTNHILSSLSPPCRDRPQLDRLFNSPLHSTPLQAPRLISECADKLDWANRWKPSKRST